MCVCADSLKKKKTPCATSNLHVFVFRENNTGELQNQKKILLEIKLRLNQLQV